MKHAVIVSPISREIRQSAEDVQADRSIRQVEQNHHRQKSRQFPEPVFLRKTGNNTTAKNFENAESAKATTDVVPQFISRERYAENKVTIANESKCPNSGNDSNTQGFQA